MEGRQECRGRISVRIVAASLGLVFAVQPGGAAAGPGLTEIVSVRSNGKQADNISARFSPPAVSADGLVVAFDSIAANLVGGDTNAAMDVFVRDRASGETERVSVSSKGKQADGFSRDPSVSAEGRFVAFTSGATNLVPGDTNGFQDVFVRDRLTGQTRLVSVGFDATPADGASLGPSISRDGRFVAFASDASNLIPAGAVPAGRDIYVRDLVTGTTQLVSVTASGQASGSSTVGDISADGRLVAFSSFSANLVPATPTTRSACSSVTGRPAPPAG